MAKALEKQRKKKQVISAVPAFDRNSSSSVGRPIPTRLVPRPQWMKDAQPELSDEEADAIWRRGTKRLDAEGMHLTSHPDVSSFTGGNTVKVLAESDHPTLGPKRAKLALDTQSDVTTSLREYLVNVHPIQPDVVNGIGGSSIFTEEGTLLVRSESRDQLVSLPALVAPAHQLPASCVALLGVPALLELEVAVDKHLRLPQFSPLICHLGEKKLRE